MNDVGGIIHVALTVQDLDRSIDFYQKNFDMSVIARETFTAYQDGFFGDSEDAPTLYGVAPGSTCALALLQQPGDGMVLELFQFIPQKPSQTVPWDRAGITHFAFETTQFDALYRRLRENGADFCMRPGRRAADGLYLIFLRDPDGNLIELLGSNPA